MLHWLAVFAYVFLMFLSAGREESSARFTRHFLQKFWPGLSPAGLRLWVFWIRKAGHVLAYAFLTLITYFAARKTRMPESRALPFALIFALAVAVLDEEYQRRLPYRSGTWSDVLIDGIGIGIVGLGIYLEVRKKKRFEVSEDVENE
ncbi:MAG: VanZ family protein [Firmicutes bacterium]|nr:VanZ family protein [Bacillota bacterium]